ncbi:MAG: hypothetical protein H6811_08750 [Phycisphaeraceae bacterium]|nr:hypothetical protein [Phycisphaeraceae bacterium]
MIRISAIALLAAVAGHASAQSIEFITPGYIATDIAADGRTLAGNVVWDGSYETFRWTAEEGAHRLGRASVPAIGRGAGTPGISRDGTRISASILSSDSRVTQGIWDIEEGWIETMPPPPADGASLDESYGSAWDISGDGSTLVGFYWNLDGDAQACSWSQAGGMLALEKTDRRSARVNAANLDGSVVVGWEERFDGPWQPRAWRNGQRYILVEQESGSEAGGVNGDGSIVCGDSFDPQNAVGSATLWRWNGTDYDMERVGFLVGTHPNSGGAWLDSVSDDGRIAVGTNMYTFNPGGQMDGIVWTPETGLVKDTDFLASLGLQAPANMDIRQFVAVTPDGSAIIGYGLLDTFEWQTFIITLPPACAADIDGDGDADGDDFFGYLDLFAAGDAAADLDGDGDRDADDFFLYLDFFAAGC